VNITFTDEYSQYDMHLVQEAATSGSPSQNPGNKIGADSIEK